MMVLVSLAEAATLTRTTRQEIAKLVQTGRLQIDKSAAGRGVLLSSLAGINGYKPPRETPSEPPPAKAEPPKPWVPDHTILASIIRLDEAGRRRAIATLCAKHPHLKQHFAANPLPPVFRKPVSQPVQPPAPEPRFRPRPVDEVVEPRTKPTSQQTPALKPASGGWGVLLVLLVLLGGGALGAFGLPHRTLSAMPQPEHSAPLVSAPPPYVPPPSRQSAPAPQPASRDYSQVSPEQMPQSQPVTRAVPPTRLLTPRPVGRAAAPQTTADELNGRMLEWIDKQRDRPMRGY